MAGPSPGGFPRQIRMAAKLARRDCRFSDAGPFLRCVPGGFEFVRLTAARRVRLVARRNRPRAECIARGRPCLAFPGPGDRPLRGAQVDARRDEHLHSPLSRLRVDERFAASFLCPMRPGGGGWTDGKRAYLFARRQRIVRRIARLVARDRSKRACGYQCLTPDGAVAVILQFGWRAGYVGLAALVACLALPTVDLWIGRAPIRRQASPVGDAAKPLLGWRQLLGNRRVLLLCLAAGLGYAPATPS